MHFCKQRITVFQRRYVKLCCIYVNDQREPRLPLGHFSSVQRGEVSSTCADSPVCTTSCVSIYPSWLCIDKVLLATWFFLAHPHSFYLPIFSFSCVVKCLGRKSRKDCLSVQGNTHHSVAKLTAGFCILRNRFRVCCPSFLWFSLFANISMFSWREDLIVYKDTSPALSSPPASKGPLLILHCIADALQFHLQGINLSLHCSACM